MKKNINKQFEQFFRMFECIVKDYDERSWLKSGHGSTVPSNLSFHILQSIKYYSKNTNGFLLSDGRELSHDHGAVDRLEISRSDILSNARLLKSELEQWVNEMDLSDHNGDFKWTGEDMESVVIFIIRHSYFHLGELNALLNEYKKGSAEDHFAHNIY